MPESDGSSLEDGFALEFELRRVGVDLDRLGGLAADPSLTLPQLIQWLRRLPTGLGHEAFMVRLAEAEFQLADGEELPADSGFADPELEERRALYRELERVAPADDEDAHGDDVVGVTFTSGLAAATAILRTMPDRAGMRAVVRALQGAALPPDRHLDRGV